MIVIHEKKVFNLLSSEQLNTVHFYHQVTFSSDTHFEHNQQICDKLSMFRYPTYVFNCFYNLYIEISSIVKLEYQ